MTILLVASKMLGNEETYTTAPTNTTPNTMAIAQDRLRTRPTYSRRSGIVDCWPAAGAFADGPGVGRSTAVTCAVLIAALRLPWPAVVLPASN